MPYELNTKQLFLTYPQCSIPKEDAYRYLEEILAPYNVQKILVAHEHHKNGTDHLHVYIQLERPYRTRDSTSLDLKVVPFPVAHGNYQGCRSAKNVVKYCTKEDNYLANFDIPSLLSKKSSHSVLGKRILAGESLIDIVKEEPQLLFRYASIKSSIDMFMRDEAMQRESIPAFLPNPWGRVLFGRRQRKKRHYWIFSRAPNKGKTTLFALPLCEQYRFYLKACDFSYWNIRRDDEGIIIDEYNTAALKWSVLNQLCDGTYEFRVFQGGLQKLVKPLIIVLSNQSISDLYPHMNNLLYERFNEIEIV